LEALGRVVLAEPRRTEQLAVAKARSRTRGRDGVHAAGGDIVAGVTQFDQQVAARVEVIIKADGHAEVVG